MQNLAEHFIGINFDHLHEESSSIILETKLNDFECPIGVDHFPIVAWLLISLDC